MATVDRRRLLLAIAVAGLCLAADGEIHRAKSLNARPRLRPHDQPYHPALWPPSRPLALYPPMGDEGNETGPATGSGSSSWMTEVVWGHEAQTWVYSVAAASLVGLSGILPLLVIPIEAGRSLRSGAANHRLKLLLSFAVGGLLGDVFLHLLPETWVHLKQLGGGRGGREGHLKVGLWLLTGLLSFFIIQKIFPESEMEDEPEEVTEEVTEEATGARQEGKEKTELPKEIPNPNGKTYVSAKERKQRNGIISNGVTCGKKPAKKETGKTGSGQPITSNGVGALPGVEKRFSGENWNKGSSEEGSDDGWMDSLRKWVLGGSKQNQFQSSHIKTSGWLNLMANMIDNFTHGLAVAGSFSISPKTGLLTTVAILLHEIPHEIGDFAILLKAGFDRWRAAKAQLLTATGGMFGALIALAAESTKEAGERTAWILPFTAGGFIYIALVTIVPDLLRENNPWHSLKQFVFLCAGISTMAAVSLLVD